MSDITEKENKFLRHQYELLQNAYREVEQKLWDKDQQAFENNYVIDNQSYEISLLKSIISQLENAKSLRLARFVKSRLLGRITRKNDEIKIDEKRKSGQYTIDKNMAAMSAWALEIKNRKEVNGNERLWMKQLPNDKEMNQFIKDMQTSKKLPKISIILPVYNIAGKWLTKSIESVLRQIYQNWELCIVDDASTHAEISIILERFSAMDDRIKVKYNEKNSGISRSSNNALPIATGNYITFLDHDDYLSPNALLEVYRAIEEEQADFIYSDEAIINPFDKMVNVFFKPDFSPEFLLSLNYINHLMVIKKDLIDAVGGFKEGIEGAQDYDIALKTSEIAKKIYHIHKILYFWRLSSGTFSATRTNRQKIHDAGRCAIEDALERRGVTASVYQSKRIYNYYVKRKILNNPKISIIIPFRDKIDLLTTCLDSVLFNTKYDNFEIIGISNNSQKKETFSEMRHFEKIDERVKFYEYDIEFNYSKINNFGVDRATGDHVVLMNSDIEVINSEWLVSLLEHSQRNEVGAVGGKLYYPNNKIQHAGVILGIAGSAGHSHRHFPRDSDGSMNRLVNVHNVSAVTGALLMVKKSLYNEVGGLDEEHLTVALNDIDFCLKLRKKEYLNIFTPYCEAYHHESVTRGYDTTLKQKIKFEQERNFFTKKWANILQKDPYYNLNLTLEEENFSQRSEQEYTKNIMASSLLNPS